MNKDIASNPNKLLWLKDQLEAGIVDTNACFLYLSYFTSSQQVPLLKTSWFLPIWEGNVWKKGQKHFLIAILCICFNAR